MANAVTDSIFFKILHNTFIPFKSMTTFFVRGLWLFLTFYCIVFILSTAGINFSRF